MARAWVDPEFKKRLLADASAAIAELGYAARAGEHLVVVENTPDRHNLVVCTLCSCYPWPVLGLPPVWYKSAPYRSRAVIDPRGVLREFGLDLDENVEIRVWDSTSEMRYLVLARSAPPAAKQMSEDELAALVTRDAMIGTAKVTPRREPRDERRPRHGRDARHGADRAAKPNEPVFHETWEARVFALNRATAALGKWNIDAGRHSRERIPPADYLRMSYYEKWLAGLVMLLEESGLVSREELSSGRPAPGAAKATPPLTAEQVPHRWSPTAAGSSARSTTPPRFAVGQAVRAKKINPTGHTRLPRYARGTVGRRRPYPWRPCVPRQQRAFPGREPAAPLLGAVFGARAVGRGSGGPRCGLYRPVGRLSRSGLNR